MCSEISQGYNKQSITLQPQYIYPYQGLWHWPVQTLSSVHSSISRFVALGVIDLVLGPFTHIKVCDTGWHRPGPQSIHSYQGLWHWVAQTWSSVHSSISRFVALGGIDLVLSAFTNIIIRVIVNCLIYHPVCPCRISITLPTLILTQYRLIRCSPLIQK